MDMPYRDSNPYMDVHSLIPKEHGYFTTGPQGPATIEKQMVLLSKASEDHPAPNTSYDKPYYYLSHHLSKR